jgi:hypothetical protein
MLKRGRPARVSKALQIDYEKLSILKTKGLKRKQDSDQNFRSRSKKINKISIMFISLSS